MKFRCKLSGTIAEFFYEHDILTMLEHPQYDVVDEVQKDLDTLLDKHPKTKKQVKGKE